MKVPTVWIARYVSASFRIWPICLTIRRAATEALDSAFSFDVGNVKGFNDVIFGRTAGLAGQQQAFPAGTVS
jgi:hypothetical protein